MKYEKWEGCEGCFKCCLSEVLRLNRVNRGVSRWCCARREDGCLEEKNVEKRRLMFLEEGKKTRLGC